MRCRVLDSASIVRDQLTSKPLSDAPCPIRVCLALFVDGYTCLTVLFAKGKCHIFYVGLRSSNQMLGLRCSSK